MDAWTVAGVAALFAVAALVFAIVSVLASRSALTKAAAAAAANRAQVERAGEAAQAARREASEAIKRLADVERKLIDSQTELQLAFQRASQLEQRLGETEERLRQATSDVPPPPIPTGRTVGRLDDLRATLRAQAAESTDEDRTT